MKEEWSDILGYEGYYQISSFGRVRSLDRVVPHKRHSCGLKLRGNIIKPTINKDGYKKCILQRKCIRKTFLIHRLVVINFIKNNYNKLEVNHIDGNKINNNLKNLEWCSRNENQTHAFKKGLMSRKGEKHNLSKLSKKEVIEIFNKYHNGKKSRDLAKKYNVSQHCILDIQSGRSWKHLKLNEGLQ